MIKSRYGNITIDGSPDSPSYTLYPSTENFLDYIEDDIKPLVLLFLETGIITISSCQGHQYDDDYDPTKGTRSITAHIKYCTNDVIDSVLLKAIEPYSDILCFYKTEYVRGFGYTSEISFYETESRETLVSHFKIIEDVLRKVFRDNHVSIRESIAIFGFDIRKDFSKLNIMFDLEYIFKPGTEPIGFFEHKRYDLSTLAEYLGTADFRICSNFLS